MRIIPTPMSVPWGMIFYLTASSFSCVPGLPILHSKDLVNWKVVNYALKELVPTDFTLPRSMAGVYGTEYPLP